MSMENMPDVRKIGRGTMWSHRYNLFSVKVYTPENDLPGQVINFGFKAPELVVFEEHALTEEAAADHARESGLEALAASFDSSVIYVCPNSSRGWEDADPGLYAELVSESKIGPFYENGVLIQKDFFGHGPDRYYIRGAIFRICLYGRGAAADFIARNCLKTLQGEYLWGPGEITPSAVCLERLSVLPEPERDDIAVISVGNSEEINQAFRAKCKYLLEKDRAEYEKDWRGFTVRFKRWCGVIEEEPNFSVNGSVEEYGVTEVKTSPDNNGRYRGTETHPLGYFAYYPQGLTDEGRQPLVIAFHGGGDSAQHICHVSGWWRIATRNRFLLIAVENHMDVTATEVQELIAHLKTKYPVDEHRIYATGFSMGGCKTWDMFQEYPETFAALAPMDATFEVGRNMFGQPAPKMNTDVPVPLFYAGGEETPLPELPFQADKCTERIEWVFGINRLRKPYTAKFGDRESWENRIWGVTGDRTEKIRDESRDAILTLNRFDDVEGKEMTVLASVSPQGHECREHTCENAWFFMQGYTR